MPIVIVCANGHKSFVRDEHAGKKALCPICRVVVPVPDPRLTADPFGTPTEGSLPPPLPIKLAPESVQTVNPVGSGTVWNSPAPVSPPGAAAPGGVDPLVGKKDAAPTKRQALEKVHLGLTFHYARLVLLLVSVVTLIGCLVFSAMAAKEQKVVSTTGVLAIVTIIVTAALSLVQPILGMVGSMLCLWVPAKSEAKGFILASLVVDALTLPVGLGLTILAMALQVGGEQSPLKLLAALATAPMGMISWILFIFFLRKLAYYLRQQDHGDDALRLVIQALAIVVLGPVALGLAFVLFLFVWWLGVPSVLVTIFAGAGMMLKTLFSTLEIIGALQQSIRPTKQV
jgi:hypothetical protein